MFLCLAHAGHACIVLENRLSSFLSLFPSSFLSMGSVMLKPFWTGNVLYLGTFLPQKLHVMEDSLPLVFV